MIQSAPDFEQVYGEFLPKVARYVASRIANHADAEDVLSAVFLKVADRLAEFDASRASLSTWIYVIARNQVTDYYRRRSDLPLPDGFEPAGAPLPPDADELLDRLAIALEKLPERQRVAVVLRYYDGLDHRQIARRLGVSYASARKICSLGVLSLRKELTS